MQKRKCDNCGKRLKNGHLRKDVYPAILVCGPTCAEQRDLRGIDSKGFPWLWKEKGKA